MPAPKEASVMAQFGALADQTRQRVGGTRRARLEWVVRQVQQSRAGMTPGQWEDFTRELAVFATGVRGGGARSDEQGDIERPAPDAARKVMASLEQMLSAVAEQKPSIPVGTWRNKRRLFLWQGRYQLLSENLDSGIDWDMDAREKLSLLLEEFGHLVRACPAPARHRKGLTCGTLFVAVRAGQQYCSTKCQARAGTRRFRDERTTRKLKRRKKRGGR